MDRQEKFFLRSQVALEVVGRRGLSNQPALEERAAHGSQDRGLFLRLDALCNDPMTKTARELRNRLHESGIASADVCDELAIDLDAMRIVNSSCVFRTADTRHSDK